MKKLLLSLALCGLFGGAPARAQAPPPDSLRQHLNYLFAPLNKAQVPAPFLEEYGLRFLPLDVFNGTLTDSSRSTIQAFRMAYASLNTGFVTGSNPLPPLADLNARLRTFDAAPVNPIIVQRINYAVLRPDALTAGLFTAQNGQLFDAPGRTQSPYLARVLFMAAPAHSAVPTGNVAFVFQQTLHVQNGGGTLRAISLDFGDGRGYLPATWGQPLTATYCTAGIRRVKVRVSYYVPDILATPNTSRVGSGGAVSQAAPAQPSVSYESHFDLNVQAPGCAPVARYATDIFVRDFPATAQHAGASVTVRYGNTNTAGVTRTQLTRPLIVAEGYDPSSIAPALQKNYTIQDFLSSIDRNNFNLYNALEGAAGPGGTNGYDVVFIDYNNGTDDIRRNAALFRDVVAWVNSVKVGGTGSGLPNVVLGVSMGGLVARYGLAQMERAAPGSTHTRLLLTHDSPHRGSNAPLGLQALTRQVNATLAVQLVGGINYLFGRDIFPEIFQADALLDAPATGQLLLVRATRAGVGPVATFGTSYNSFIANDYQPMVTGNFPYQFVAASLGSQCGISSLNPYDELARLQISGFLSPLPWLRRTSYKTEIVVNALPYGGQVERIASLRIYRQVRTLLVFNSRTYYSNFSFNSPAANPIAWDGLPGGTQNVREQAKIDLPTGSVSLLWFFNLSSSFQLAGDFCFIPTASALDVPLTTTSVQARYVNGATSNPAAPVALRFVAQERLPLASGANLYNYPHPLFPGRQAQWLFDEMQRPFNGNTNAVACSPNPECDPSPLASIDGPNLVCASADYRINNLPAGATVAWSIPASAQGLLQLQPNVPGPGQLRITNWNVGTVTTTLTATITGAGPGGCATVRTQTVSNVDAFPYFQESCWFYNVNHPSESGTINGGNSTVVHQGCTVYVDLGPMSRTATLSASGARPTVWGTQPGRYPNTLYFQLPIGSGGAPFTFDIAGGQGCTSQQLVFFSITGNGRPAPTAVLYPNPATTSVDVHTDNATAADPITVQLFDAYGAARATQTSTGAATVRLPTDALPAGLYFVHLLRGQEVLSRQQLRVEK